MKQVPPHLDEKTGKIVEKEYLYIAFYCEINCQVTVTVMTEREAESLAKTQLVTHDSHRKHVKPDLTALEKSLYGKKSKSTTRFRHGGGV